MNEHGSVSQWIGPLRDGDSAAALKLWNHYYAQLVQLARRKLAAAPRRVADEEDVVVCAFESFCRGVEAGRFPQLADRDDLWQVLVVLTARKAANQLKHHARQKRGGHRVRGESIFLHSPGEDALGLDELFASAPTPEFADGVVHACRDLLEHLKDSTLQEVAVMKLEGYTNDEIAQRLGVKTRTVERKLNMIRQMWSREQ
jgi:DNA-directed RNA polymerase specialized sigma24 family protein